MTTIGMGTLERTSKKKENKGGDAAEAEVTRADQRRTAATTVWPGSQPWRRDNLKWNLTLWS